MQRTVRMHLKPVPEMKNKKKITLWDSDPLRIEESSANIYRALSKTGADYYLEFMSETPLIGRKGLRGKLPALETESRIWTWKTGEPFPEKALIQLFEYLKEHDGDDRKK